MRRPSPGTRCWRIVLAWGRQVRGNGGAAIVRRSAAGYHRRRRPPKGETPRSNGRRPFARLQLARIVASGSQPNVNGSLLGLPRSTVRPRPPPSGGSFGSDRFRASRPRSGAGIAVRGLVAAQGPDPRRRAPPGAAPDRHGVPDPRRQRGAGFRLPGAARALDGQLRVRHLRLCLDLGAAARPADRPRARHRRATLHSGISRPRHARAAARVHFRQPLARHLASRSASRCVCAGWSGCSSRGSTTTC